MNNIVNNYLLDGDKFIPELHLRQDLLITLANHLLKSVKGLKISKKQGI